MYYFEWNEGVSNVTQTLNVSDTDSVIRACECEKGEGGRPNLIIMLDW